jgi:hypothetical protein
LAGTLGGLRIDFQPCHPAASLAQVAADETIGASQFKDVFALASEINEDAVPPVTVPKYSLMFAGVAQGAGPGARNF